MTVFDEIAETNRDNECKAWWRKVLNLKVEIATFCRQSSEKWSGQEIIGLAIYLLKGFFQLQPSHSIPKPGHTAFRDEEATNEAQFMKYLSPTTTIPLPRALNWGFTWESPHQLGPLIIMDYVNGTRLSTILKQPTQKR
ncbi:hypothetical protein AJ78_08212 [Emergomyces pasteurianus Ep9510]|uniref:Aminoglycoside phosphotransferase domain-containing protein n=1 Tax=Emergomyces pasteurianus Ep9510 TaxID=1447872 RepID=A0A1J9P4V9_9EURO|nr:hypothetical protein AJ78_08212 [Emergomyces pasteurianus Ep9510]